VGAASSTQPNGSARTARGDPAACFGVNHACAGCSTVAAVHFDSSRTETRGGASRRAALNPAGGYRIKLSWYKAGVDAVEWALQLHTESWYMGGCYQDTRPITVGTRPWDAYGGRSTQHAARSTLQRSLGQSMVGWGGVRSKGRRDGAEEGDAVGRCWGGLCALCRQRCGGDAGGAVARGVLARGLRLAACGLRLAGCGLRAAVWDVRGLRVGGRARLTLEGVGGRFEASPCVVGGARKCD